MRKIYILPFAIFLFFHPLTTASDAVKMKKIITSEQLQTAGITRISDILLLIDEWNTATIEGYTWLTSPAGLTNYQRNNIIFMIDGKKYDVTSFDIQNFNMLPVTINQIDSIEIFSTPQVERGEFTENGMIHIHTAKVIQGSSLQFEYTGGNVTGEPGPYEGTKYSSSDLQRIGEDYALTFQYGFKNKYIRSFVIQQQHPFMDPALSGRCYKILDPPSGQKRLYPGLWFDKTANPKMQRLSFSVKFGGKKFELQTDYSYSFRYFLFFKPLGQEIPVNYIYYHTGLNGILFNDLQYRFGYLYTILEKHPNALDFDFNWKLHHLNGDINKDYNLAFIQGNIGFSFDSYIQSLQKISNGLFKCYTNFDYKLTSYYQHHIGCMLLYNKDNTTYKAAWNNVFIIDPNHDLNVYLSYSKRNLAEDNNIWYWTRQGYDLLDRYSIGYYDNDNIEAYDIVTAGLQWNAELDTNLSFIMNSGYKNFHNMYLEMQNFQINSDNYSLHSPLIVKSNQQGQFFKQSMEIRWRFLRGFTHKIFYSYQKPIHGDPAFIQAWKPISTHKAIYQIHYHPLSEFSLWCKLSYLSTSYWPEYDDIDGYIYYRTFNAQYRYRSVINPNLIIDFQIQKWFWNRKINAKFLLRNVTNKQLRYYPVGVTFGLSYYVQLGLNL
jgi:hypothetical protein